MILSYVWCGFILVSAFFILLTGSGPEATKAIIDGAGEGVQISIAIAGPMCLWAGIGNLMNAIGATERLSKLFSPVLRLVYPSAQHDPVLAGNLSANFCANLLGLGNAATPMGIRAAQRLKSASAPKIATDEMCRLVVMNTASIQLLPTTVAALRQNAGAQSPFDIIPCVWATSILSVSAGLCAAFVLKRWWSDV